MKVARYSLLVAVVLASAGLIVFSLCKETAEAPDPGNQETARSAERSTIKPQAFNKSQHSLTEPDSLWVIVNKSRPVPLGYSPSGLVTPEVRLNERKSPDENTLRQAVAQPLKELFDAARQAGYDLMLASGYRSSQLQAAYYNSYADRDGQAAADRYSARPGTSEHQTGLALDIARADRHCYLEDCFGSTAEARWLAENSYKYGFIVRYPAGEESVTGYQYEPWHFRFVGKELAGELYRTGQTVGEFFGL